MATVTATATLSKISSSKRRSKSAKNVKTQIQQEPILDYVETTNSAVKTQANNSINEQSLEFYQPNGPDQQNETVNFLNKIHALRYALEIDCLASDAKWTLFVTAALSFRYDSVLKPFPSRYAEEQNGCNIDALISAINDTPKLKVILQNIVEKNYTDFTSEVIELLHWVIIILREPALRLIETEELNCILTSIDEKAIKIKPTHVFEVSSFTGFHSELAFRQRISNLPTKMAFMGNKLDNYFSILQNGFTNPPEHNNFFELTTNLATSLKESPSCAAWGASQCGSIISCTAVCEFAYDTSTDQISPNKDDKSCVNIYLQNPQNIRVRYLLFYGKRFPKRLQSKRRLLSWLYHHKYSLSLLSYLLFLITIGIASSGNGETLKFYIWKKLNYVLDFYRRIIT